MNKQFVKLGFRAKKSGHPCLAFVTLLLNTFTENEKQIWILPCCSQVKPLMHSKCFVFWLYRITITKFSHTLTLSFLPPLKIFYSHFLPSLVSSYSSHAHTHSLSLSVFWSQFSHPFTLGTTHTHTHTHTHPQFIPGHSLSLFLFHSKLKIETTNSLSLYLSLSISFPPALEYPS